MSRPSMTGSCAWKYSNKILEIRFEDKPLIILYHHVAAHWSKPQTSVCILFPMKHHFYLAHASRWNRSLFPHDEHKTWWFIKNPKIFFPFPICPAVKCYITSPRCVSLYFCRLLPKRVNPNKAYVDLQSRRFKKTNQSC